MNLIHFVFNSAPSVKNKNTLTLTKKMTKKSCASAGALRFANLVKPFDQIF